MCLFESRRKRSVNSLMPPPHGCQNIFQPVVEAIWWNDFGFMVENKRETAKLQDLLQ
jgi:hypothetical protein